MNMTRFLLAVAILMSMLTPTTGLSAGKLIVDVSNIDVSKGGDLIVLVFGDDGFPKKHEKALMSKTRKVTEAVMTFEFEMPDIPELAVKVLHDDDKNGRVTKNWTGIWPREGLGFSNDTKMGSFGPPGFSSAKLAAKEAREGVFVMVFYP